MNVEEVGPEQEPLTKGLDTGTEQKLLFGYNNRVELYNAARSERLTDGIDERIAQKWAKRLKEDKDGNMLEKQTNIVNRKTSQLQEEHKALLISFYDKYPQARMGDTITPLTKKFKNFSLKTSSVQVLLKDEYESGFGINMRPFGGLSEKGTPAIVTTPSTRAASYPILGAINVKFVMTLESRNPQTFKRIEIDYVDLKRKAPTN
ncbi:hypothetical protein G6F43_012540 [Rhizopus delemar]|nr:hypothetical protein G6F43_012540 [Rhizopus delemar]